MCPKRLLRPRQQAASHFFLIVTTIMKTVNEAGKQWDVWFSSADGANIGVAFRIFCRPSLMRLIN